MCDKTHISLVAFRWIADWWEDTQDPERFSLSPTCTFPVTCSPPRLTIYWTLSFASDGGEGLRWWDTFEETHQSKYIHMNALPQKACPSPNNVSSAEAIPWDTLSVPVYWLHFKQQFIALYYMLYSKKEKPTWWPSLMSHLGHQASPWNTLAFFQKLKWPQSLAIMGMFTHCQKLGGNSNREVSKMFSSVTASIANKSMVPQGQYFEGADTH